MYQIRFRIQSIPKHRETLGGELQAYCHFMPCGNEKISTNYVFFQLNINKVKTYIIN